jgi:hypothetical protein
MKWIVGITDPGKAPYYLIYYDIKDFRAFAKFWRGRESSFKIDLIGGIPE